MADLLGNTMKALKVNGEHWVEVAESPIVSPSENEVLVKVEAAGINPTDWKHAKFLSEKGVIAGCDFAGTVVEVARHGSQLKNIQIGDRVGGFVHGSKYPDKGAFAQYLTVEAGMTFKIPKNVSFEEAATVGVPFFTAAQVLYHRLGLPEPDFPATTAYSILIWSGSTAVGQYAIQLARLSGLSVITTANPSHHDHLVKLGADVCLDYKDPEISKKIREAAHDNLRFALDCISDEDSVQKCVESFGKDGGKLCTLMVQQKDFGRKDVEILYTLLYTAAGKPFDMRGKHFEAKPEDRSFHEKWLTIASRLFESGKIKFLKTENRGGLENVGQAYQDIIDGKNRGIKYVINP
eukprot:TRINITY_DN4920_c0_g1_i1.p1 TRINITY_DN4920_c0_g1~~TRINITY_DN4920_c0_g1_i1.p1  ORF type:complete len:350 (+),score=115.79 TRINITY_DN4920_c0_g1_i1:63-1112(+)